MDSANVIMYPTIGSLVIVAFLCQVIYTANSFHMNGFKLKHVDKIASFNNFYNNNHLGHHHIVKMSKLTDSAQERLLKDAEKLRQMADTLEKTNETDSTPESGFISTYAVKIANNITKQKRNETLYFGPTKPYTSANVTKEYLLIDRSNSDDDTPTVKLENLIKTTMLEYLNMSEAELEAADEKKETSRSATSSTATSGLSSFNDAESMTNLLDTSYSLRVFLTAYDEILQQQPNAKTYAALQVLDDYIQWHINTLHRPFKKDASNKMKLDQAFIFLARKLEIERFLRRLNKDSKYLVKVKESSYTPQEQDNTIATSFMEHNVYFDVAYDTLEDGTIVVNPNEAYLCANKLYTEILQALAVPVRKVVDEYIVMCTDKSENGRKGLFEFLRIQDDFFSKLGTNGFLNIIPNSLTAEVTQSMDKDEFEIYKQIVWGETINASTSFVDELSNKPENAEVMEDFYQELIDAVDEPVEVYNHVIRAKLVHSLRLYSSTGWNWPLDESGCSSSSLDYLVPAMPLTSNSERQTPSQILKKTPQLSEMMFKLPSVTFLLKDVAFTPTELAANRKNITYYVASSAETTSFSSFSSSPSTTPFSPFNPFNKNKDQKQETSGGTSQTRMIFPVALLKRENKAFFYEKLTENCNIVRNMVDKFMAVGANSTDEEIISLAGQISPYSIAASLAVKKEKELQEKEAEVFKIKTSDIHLKNDIINNNNNNNNNKENESTTVITSSVSASTESAPIVSPATKSTDNNRASDQSLSSETTSAHTGEIDKIDNNKDSTESDILFATRENTEIVSNDKSLPNNFQIKFQELIDKLDSEGGNEMSLLSQPKSAVDAFIRQYFDEYSRTKGSALSRQGAGLFQSEMLKGVMEVNNVTPLYGAYVFDGRYVTRNSKQFYEKLNTKFENSTMSNDLSYIITTNRQYPAMNDTITDIAYAMMGETTSVILFPKTWNTTLQSTDEQLKFQSFFKSLNILSSAIVAGNCYNLFDPNGPLAKDNSQLPDGYIGLVILPIILQIIPLVIESIVAAQKGIKITSIQLPAWVSLPTFGYRSVYTSRPKTRNDMFDIAAVGWFSSFVLSFATALIGLKLTSEASSDVLATFPSMSVLLLQLNPIVKQVLGSVFPLAAATPAPDMSTSIHLHWIAIAGLMSMIVNSLQLIPTNQSVGNKLLYSFYGIYQYSIVQQAVALFRFVFNAVWIIASFSFTESIFTINSRSALLFTFLFSEIQAFLPTEQGDQVVVDDVTGITESRKIAFAGIACLLAFVLFSDGLSEMAVDIGNLVKSVMDGGLPKNTLF